MVNEVIARQLRRLFFPKKDLYEDECIALAFSLMALTYRGFLEHEDRYYDRFWGMVDIFSISFDIPRTEVFEALETISTEL